MNWYSMKGRMRSSTAKYSAPRFTSKWSTRFTSRPKRSMRVTDVPRPPWLTGASVG